jgi:hypothetical protein
VAEKRLKGYSTGEIAKAIGRSEHTVEGDLARLFENWGREAQANFSQAQILELRRIDLREKAAWEGWERSLLERRKDKTRITTGGRGGQQQMGESQTERPVGDPRFLSEIAQCSKQRCQMLGLFTPEKFPGEVGNNVDGGLKFETIEDLDAEFKRVFNIALPPAPLSIAPDKLPPGFRRG